MVTIYLSLLYEFPVLRVHQTFHSLQRSINGLELESVDIFDVIFNSSLENIYVAKFHYRQKIEY